MLSVRPRSPVDYSKCNQTVTIYHKDGDTYTQKVVSNAFLEYRKTENVDKTGSKEVNSFLLVIPCTVQPVFIEDKVLHGVGPTIATREAWATLIPTKVPGLVVVKSADPKYWKDKMVHVEAGG